MPSLALTPDLLIAAYREGFFPMDVAGTIRWFRPDPRTVIPLNEFHVSRRLARTLRSGTFEVRINTAFGEVMRGCARRDEGTWISEEIMAAYGRLHRLGLAHSVEAWRGAQLVGGVYGVALGGAFFGESMFHAATNASKVALAALVERLKQRGYTLFDVQYRTPHLEKFGALAIPHPVYAEKLKEALAMPTTFF